MFQSRRLPNSSLSHGYSSLRKDHYQFNTQILPPPTSLSHRSMETLNRYAVTMSIPSGMNCNKWRSKGRPSVSTASITSTPYSTFEFNIRTKVWAKLNKIDKRLANIGYDSKVCSNVVDLPIENKNLNGVPTIENMIRAINKVIVTLKPRCRIDERLYSLCGDLVHTRICLKEAPFNSWLTSRMLDLRTDVFDAIHKERDLVQMTIVRFYGEKYDAICRLGLQSALKYEEIYLADLENGKKESLGQFFARLAASAATEAVMTPQMAAAVTTGIPSWGTAFGVFFWALAHQSFVPATPSMLYTGRKNKSTSSCYLLDPKCNSVDSSILSIMNEVVPLLRARGGIGISLNGVNGENGIMPTLKLLDSLVAATNVDCIRSTAVCVYLEPWHADILSAMAMRGMLAAEESRRCNNLYLALWSCDLLFKRYERYLNGENSVIWTLFDGSSCGKLSLLYGDEFEEEYERLESQGLGTTSIHVRDFMYEIIKSAIVTGSPFVLFKDAFNRHFHLNTQGDALACSNLCTEIVHKTGPNESGVCNLASVNLASFVKYRNDLYRESGNVTRVAKFDFQSLRHATRVAVIFANVCASGEKPTKSTAIGGARHRTIGVGVQGFHTAILELGLNLEDEETRDLNKKIFELILLEAMTVSCELCENGLEPFMDFSKSAYSRGWIHFDDWSDVTLTAAEEWDALRGRIAVSGLYNSQFIALMPTAASAQVTEVSEGFSPIYSNLYSKITSTGELPKPNIQFMRDLRSIYNGDKHSFDKAIQALEDNAWSVELALGHLPECAPLKKYKTAFDYNQHLLIDLCRDRAPFVDQSQSMTLFITETSDGQLLASKIMELLMHAYKCGLKTGMYYCKIKKATNNGIFAGAGNLVCSGCVI